MNDVAKLRADELRLAKCASRDRQAAEELLLRVRPRVKRAIRILVGADQDAEDLVNQTLLAVMESAKKYKGEGSLEAWAGRIAFNVTMKHMKRRWMSEKIVVLDTKDSGVSRSNPEQEVANLRFRNRVEVALEKLPVERRATLVLRLVFGHSLAEISELTGVPVNTVRGRLRTGLKELRANTHPKNATVIPLDRRRRRK